MQCDNSGKPFSSSIDISVHTDNIHSGSSEPCDNCGNTTTINPDIRVHSTKPHCELYKPCDNRGNTATSKTHSNDCQCKMCDQPLIDEKTTWVTYDNDMSLITNSIEVQLNSGEISPAEAASLFNRYLTEFLESKPNLLHEVKTFYKHKPESMKDISDAKKLKTSLNKKAKQKDATEEDKALACLA